MFRRPLATDRRDGHYSLAGFLRFRDDVRESREFSEQTLHSNSDRHVAETFRGLLFGLERSRR